MEKYKDFFDKCEIPTSLFNRKFAETSSTWKMVAKTWETFQYRKALESKLQIKYNKIIPNTIHFIWMGKPLPEQYAIYIEDWRQKTGMTVNVWSDDKIAEFIPQMQNKKLFEQATNFGQKSDLLRYEILYNYGGIYVDTDYLCLDFTGDGFKQLNRCTDFWSGICLEKEVQINNGIMASKAGHPVLSRCIEQCRLDNPWKIECPMTATLYQTGPWVLTNAILLELILDFGDNDITIFPAQTFHPFPAAMRHSQQQDILMHYIKPDSLACHLWHSSYSPNSHFSQVK